MFIKFNNIILKKQEITAVYINSATYQLIIERCNSDDIKFYYDTKEAAYQKLNELWELLQS